MCGLLLPLKSFEVLLWNVFPMCRSRLWGSLEWKQENDHEWEDRCLQWSCSQHSEQQRQKLQVQCQVVQCFQINCSRNHHGLFGWLTPSRIQQRNCKSYLDVRRRDWIQLLTPMSHRDYSPNYSCCLNVHVEIILLSVT